jgi:hypothetical protein
MSDYGTVVHLKRDPFDVRIDRATAWGNPFVLGHDGDRDVVLARYREWVTTSDDLAAVWVRENVHRLRGKTLGCWCAPNMCHGIILLEMANENT